MQHLLIANPENRRVAFFQSALKKLNLAPARVVSYEAAIDDFGLLEDALEADSILRIESPGENEIVTRKLIALGAENPERDPFVRARFISTAEAMSLTVDEGRLQHVAQWYYGYSKFLSSITALTNQRSIRFHNHPADIEMMFDKRRTQAVLVEADVTVPQVVQGIECCEHLLQRMADEQLSRVFVKMAFSSSAAGVLALWRSRSGDLRAVTPVEIEYVDGTARFYNNLQMQTYTEPEQIAQIIDFILAEGAQIEHWLPKASIRERNFDLRILVVKGKPQHCVVRTSRSPITNLHLGNRRGDLDELKRLVGQAKWKAAMSVAEKASSIVSRSLYVGVDLLLKPGYRDPTVLELNAFGDLLPNVLDGNRDTYEAEIAATL